MACEQLLALKILVWRVYSESYFENFQKHFAIKIMKTIKTFKF